MIYVFYWSIAGIANTIIDANTPGQEIIVKKYVGNESETIIIDGVEKEIIKPRYISEKNMVKPEDMFQLYVPDVGFILQTFCFLIFCYILIYILRGKVRFLPWR